LTAMSLAGWKGVSSGKVDVFPRWSDKGSYNLLWSQCLLVVRALQILAIVSEINPQIDGHGDPPKVSLRARRSMFL
jgi:hypothetical protein